MPALVEIFYVQLSQNILNLSHREIACRAHPVLLLSVGSRISWMSYPMRVAFHEFRGPYLYMF